MSIQLNHIGIAVGDSAGAKALQNLFAILGINKEHEEDVPDQGVKTHFLPIRNQGMTQLELLEPNSEGPVRQFLAKRGPGVHHLAFDVGSGNLVETCDRLRAAGYRMIYDAPKSGAHGMRINFIHPASAGGILVELLEGDSRK